jgi:uncharacterized protein (DUF2147 family)
MKLRLATLIAIAIPAAFYAHSAAAQDDAAPPAKPTTAVEAPAPDAKPAALAPKQKKAAIPGMNQFKTAAGFWKQFNDDGSVGGWFYFVQKDGVYEGRLVKIFKKPGGPVYSNVCEKCEGDQKEAPMLGLTMIKGMKRDGHSYQEGSILDPRDGTVYHAQMELSSDGKSLSVRGYLGIPLLGQTQVWKRLSDDAMAAEDIPAESLGPTAKAARADTSQQ